ncbi:hypothetical protein Nepgr_006569 [Nepenthes gracilis]|uniref:Uncharacterized protein n=1 Tax=Nepenthes gracilis TaxID=150966 RepID=A0AAD3S5B0_NEPGR|nr:hypothetical protein Nepgr_006569 [Nepenthes gracilis]
MPHCISDGRLSFPPADVPKTKSARFFSSLLRILTICFRGKLSPMGATITDGCCGVLILVVKDAAPDANAALPLLRLFDAVCSIAAGQGGRIVVLKRPTDGIKIPLAKCQSWWRLDFL